MNQRTDIILEYSQDPFFCQDLLSFICGDFLGAGTFRDVFEYALDKKYVVKLQRDEGKFSNVLEFEIWSSLMHTEYRKHFAPITWMSDCGRVMIQRKTKPITDKRKPPKRIPSFFTDIKESNFGWIGKNFVAHDYDYSFVKFVDAGLKNKTKKWSPHNK